MWTQGCLEGDSVVFVLDIYELADCRTARAEVPLLPCLPYLTDSDRSLLQKPPMRPSTQTEDLQLSIYALARMGTPSGYLVLPLQDFAFQPQLNPCFFRGLSSNQEKSRVGGFNPCK